MKAILVIEQMPTECIECPFHRLYADGFLNETHCSLMAKRNKDGVNTRADWCPLKPIPNEACEMLVKGLDAMEKMKAVEVKVVRRTE